MFRTGGEKHGLFAFYCLWFNDSVIFFFCDCDAVLLWVCSCKNIPKNVL